MEDEVYGEAGEKSFRKPSSHFGRRAITVERALVESLKHRSRNRNTPTPIPERDDWRIKDPDSPHKVGK